MARNMSFALTTSQMKAGTKTVTRRMGWQFLKPGEIVNAVEKSRGLRQGEKIKRIGRIEIVDCRMERLDSISKDDVLKEGFPDMTPDQFIEMFCRSHKGCKAETIVNRIEFEHLSGEEPWK